MHLNADASTTHVHIGVNNSNRDQSVLPCQTSGERDRTRVITNISLPVAVLCTFGACRITQSFAIRCMGHDCRILSYGSLLLQTLIVHSKVTSSAICNMGRARY